METGGECYIFSFYFFFYLFLFFIFYLFILFFSNESNSSFRRPLAFLSSSELGGEINSIFMALLSWESGGPEEGGQRDWVWDLGHDIVGAWSSQSPKEGKKRSAVGTCRATSNVIGIVIDKKKRNGGFGGFSSKFLLRFNRVFGEFI